MSTEVQPQTEPETKPVFAGVNRTGDEWKNELEIEECERASTAFCKRLILQREERLRRK